MTIKRNRENVILKNGKVSCSCCEEPEGCCMYPAQALVDGDYGASDLPDAITISEVSYGRSGTAYGDTTDGVRLEGNVWAKYTNGARSERPCLIQGGVLDQFAGSYSWLSDDPFSGDPYDPVSTTVARVSLCRWEGPLLPFAGGTVFCMPVLYLYKGLADVPNEYAFVWRMQWEGDQAETGGDKIGFNNTPVGEYDVDPEPGTWVIS